MSLSNPIPSSQKATDMSKKNTSAVSHRPWGKVFAGGREHSIGEATNSPSTHWGQGDEDLYLERVREKATLMVRQILADTAQKAENMQKKAEKAGYEAGLAAAQTELESFREGLAESAAAVLSAIEGQCSHVLAQWREDLIAVARLAAEKTAGTLLNEERASVLSTLLHDALNLLEGRRELVIRVHPEDEPMISDIVNTTKNTLPDVMAWRVRSDPSLTPGGLVVESASSLADGRVEARAAAVDAILQNLSLPTLP